MKNAIVVSIALGMTLALCGCGLKVPELRPAHQDRDGEKLDENVILSQIKCELTKGVQDVVDHPPTTASPSINWDAWGATVSLTITVDEKGSIAPGITFNTVHPNAITKFANGNVTTSQTYSTSFGVSGSADATRKESISFSYAFHDLLQANKIPIDKECANEDGILIHSDLKIAEFIQNKAFLASVPGTVGTMGRGSPFSAFSDEITFVVAYSANLTPSWKLLRFSAGSQGSTPFLSGARTKTQSIILTVGPTPDADKDAKAQVRLGSEAQAVHEAALIGHAISSSLLGQ